MSYFHTIDDYTTEQLLDEVEIRISYQQQNLCPYCHFLLDTHTCKYSGKEKKYHNDKLIAQFIKNNTDLTFVQTLLQKYYES